MTHSFSDTPLDPVPQKARISLVGIRMGKSKFGSHAREIHVVRTDDEGYWIPETTTFQCMNTLNVNPYIHNICNYTYIVFVFSDMK